MKKFLLLGVLALGLGAVSGQRASAWCSFKLSAGVNMEYTGGGNCLLWGLYKSSEPPYGPAGCSPDYGAGAYGGYAMGGYGYPAAGGYGYSAPTGYGYTAPATPAPAPATESAPAPKPAAVTPVMYDASWYGNGYQPVSYYPQGMGYSYGYYYQAPSSWYGQ